MTTRKPKTNPVEAEVAEETTNTPRTFTITVKGEEIEFVDKWEHEDQLPAGMAMMGNKKLAEKYLGMVLLAIIGEEQMDDLMMAGADIEELASVLTAWANARGLGKA